MTNSIITNLIVAYSHLFGLDPNVALSVAEVESNFNPKVVGSLGEVGIFQIRPEFYKMFSRKQLMSTETNVMLGVKLLASYKNSCYHKEDITYLICYNYGPANAKKVRYPHLFPYVKKVKEKMRKRLEKTN